MPKLVMGSNQDLIFSEDSIKLIAERIPDAQYYGYSDCGHLPIIENPGGFVDVLLRFLKDSSTELG